MAGCVPAPPGLLPSPHPRREPHRARHRRGRPRRSALGRARQRLSASRPCEPPPVAHARVPQRDTRLGEGIDVALEAGSPLPPGLQTRNTSPRPCPRCSPTQRIPARLSGLRSLDSRRGRRQAGDRHRLRQPARASGRGSPSRARAVSDIRRSGSAALDLCHVAAGHVDAYGSPNGPWDDGAGSVIAGEAGAEVVLVPAAHGRGPAGCGQQCSPACTGCPLERGRSPGSAGQPAAPATGALLRPARPGALPGAGWITKPGSRSSTRTRWRPSCCP